MQTNLSILGAVDIQDMDSVAEELAIVEKCLDSGNTPLGFPLKPHQKMVMVKVRGMLKRALRPTATPKEGVFASMKVLINNRPHIVEAWGSSPLNAKSKLGDKVFEILKLGFTVKEIADA